MSLFHFELNIGEMPDGLASAMARRTIHLLSKSRQSVRGLVLAAGRESETVAFDESVVDFFVGAADVLGIPRSIAAIYGTVFASPEPLSFADIEARLDISKGSISQGLRLLREVGALMEVSSYTDRAQRFTPDLELRKLVARFLENRLQNQLIAGSAKLAQLCDSLPRGGIETAVLRERFKQLQNWHEKARALMPMAKAFLKITSV